MTDAVAVTGGSGGIVAQCDAIRRLAGRFGDVATQTVGSTAALHGYLLNPSLVASGAFDPGGLAAVETTLLDALDGSRGLSWVGVRCGLLDGELRAAAAAYETADRLSGAVEDELRGALGLPSALAGGVGSALQGRGAGRSLQRVITTDPAAADLLIDGLGLPAVIAGTAAVLPDGHGRARPLGVDPSAVARTPPRTLTALLGELSHRNDDAHHGSVDVRILRMPDGSRRVVVDITGTKSWTPLPTGDVTSLTTNGRAVSGQSGAYEQGVLRAMRRAGVHRSDPVLIVGHSEGGLVAVTAARDAVRRGEYRVTHVVTAGSPIGRTVAGLPRSVQVLALENERDLVPHLDGVANPDLPNVTTASGSFGDGTVRDDHSLPDGYEPLTRDLRHSDSVSLRHFRRGLAPYLRAASVRTHAFQIVRTYR